MLYLLKSCADLLAFNCRLNIRLHHRHSGNMLCVKLIDQENLMAERRDNHPNPNIDVNFIACHGRLLELPEHVDVDWA